MARRRGFTSTCTAPAYARERMRTRMRTPYLLVIACATIRGQVRNAMGFVDEPPEDKKLVVFPRARQGAGPVAPALAPAQKTAGPAVASSDSPLPPRATPYRLT